MDDEDRPLLSIDGRNAVDILAELVDDVKDMSGWPKRKDGKTYKIRHWKTLDGEIIALEDLENDHLKNILNHLRNNAVARRAMDAIMEYRSDRTKEEATEAYAKLYGLTEEELALKYLPHYEELKELAEERKLL